MNPARTRAPGARKVGVVALFVVSVALRLLVPAAAVALTDDGLGPLHTGDSKQYLDLAQSIARDGRYFDASGPHIFRPPGYPLMLVPGVLLGHPFLGAIFVQALLGFLTTYLTYLTALLLLGNRRIALVAGFACACEPVLVHWSGKVMAETLLTTFVIAFVYALMRYLTSASSVSWLMAAAVAVAGAAYAKPIAYFLPVWATVILLSCAVGKPDRLRRAGHAALFLMVCAVLLGAWQLRNGAVAGYFGFSTQMDRVISLPASAAVIAAQEGRPFSEVRDDFKARYEKPGSEDGEFYAAARQRGLETIGRAPGTYAWIHVKGMFQTLVNPGALPYLVMFGLHSDSAGMGTVVKDRGSLSALDQARRHDPLLFWSSVILGCILLPYLLLPALALVRWNAPGRTPRLVLASIAFYFLLLSGGAWGQSRFRHPMVPILCVLGAYALPRREGEPAPT